MHFSFCPAPKTRVVWWLLHLQVATPFPISLIRGSLFGQILNLRERRRAAIAHRRLRREPCAQIRLLSQTENADNRPVLPILRRKEEDSMAALGHLEIDRRPLDRNGNAIVGKTSCYHGNDCRMFFEGHFEA